MLKQIFCILAVSTAACAMDKSRQLVFEQYKNNAPALLLHLMVVHAKSETPVKDMETLSNEIVALFPEVSRNQLQDLRKLLLEPFENEKIRALLRSVNPFVSAEFGKWELHGHSTSTFNYYRSLFEHFQLGGLPVMLKPQNLVLFWAMDCNDHQVFRKCLASGLCDLNEFYPEADFLTGWQFFCNPEIAMWREGRSPEIIELLLDLFYASNNPANIQVWRGLVPQITIPFKRDIFADGDDSTGKQDIPLYLIFLLGHFFNSASKPTVDEIRNTLFPKRKA
jgi:hypothetical protein